MAINNRTDAISQVNTLIVPQVTNVTHRQLLNDNILNSVNFRKDIIASTSAAGGVATCDFSNTELITLSLSDSVAINFTGLQNGDLRWLYITKPTTKAVNFNSAFDVTPFIKNVTALKTSVLYEVYNKNGVVFVRAVTDTLPEAVLADIVSGDVNKIPTAKAVQDYSLQRNQTQTFTIGADGAITNLTSYYNFIGDKLLNFSCKFTFEPSDLGTFDKIFEFNIPANTYSHIFCSAYVGGDNATAETKLINQNLRFEIINAIFIAGTQTVAIWGSIPLY